MIKLLNTKVMMATAAYGVSHDLSRDEPDYCAVYSEDDENYYGRWLEGFGFINVRFPKNSTRELTDEEQRKFDRSSAYLIGRGSIVKLG